MDIEIYADVVCPWCYIGMRRLRRALEPDPAENTAANAAAGPVRLRWRAFQLDPSASTTPRPVIDALAERFGGRERVDHVLERTTTIAAAEDIELNFDRALIVNTFDAHRLIWFAARAGKQAELVEALHRAHFTEGLDVASPWALATVADSVNLAGAAAFLSSDAGVAEVRAELTRGRGLGISGVPAFIFAGKYLVTGAQDPGTLRGALEQARRREAAEAG